MSGNAKSAGGMKGCRTEQCSKCACHPHCNEMPQAISARTTAGATRPIPNGQTTRRATAATTLWSLMYDTSPGCPEQYRWWNGSM